MKVSYHNFNYEKDIILPNNLNEINNYIDSILLNLPSLKIVSNNNLLNETIKITNDFSKNKKTFIVFGTGGSNLGSRALINSIYNDSIAIALYNCDSNCKS